MAIKYFCDVCGDEIGRDYVSTRYRPTKYIRSKYLNVACEVMVRVGTAWNSGHLCRPCLIDVLTKPDCELNH